MLRYHHLGIPISAPRPGETYHPGLGFHASGYYSNPFGVEWLRFDPTSELPVLIRTVPHLGFVVDDLEAALEGQDVLLTPSSPAEGVRVAFFVHEGVPIELLAFSRPEEEVWPSTAKRTDGPLRYHHLALSVSEPREGSVHLAEYKVWAGGFHANPYGLEWMHYEADCSLPEPVKTLPHLAFEVEDLDAELAGREILIAPNAPSPGVRVAFILHEGMPIELLEFTDPNHPDRRGGA